MTEHSSEQSLQTMVEQRTGLHAELARAGHVLAVRYDIETDFMTGEPKLEWVAGKQLPTERLLEEQGYHFLAGVDITGKQLIAASSQLVHRLGIGGRYALFAEQSGGDVPFVTPNEKHTHQEMANLLLVRLHPPARIGPFGGDMQSFVRDLAVWAHYAMDQKKLRHVELQQTIDTKQTATVNIILLATTGYVE